MLRSGRWKLRVLEIGALLLLGGVGLQLGDWDNIRQATEAKDAMVAATPVLGERVDALVVSDQEGAATRLSDIGAGKCRYVVLGTRSCPHANIAADRWLATALNDPAHADMPDDWMSFWVAADDVTGRGELFDPAFPTPTFYAKDAVALIESAGMTHSPFHLVLDRSGVIVAFGSERRLLSLGAFGADCTIDPDLAGTADDRVTVLKGRAGT